MHTPDFKKLAENLSERAHLIIWAEKDRIEVVAIVKGTITQAAMELADAFPLPSAVQVAAAEGEMILDTSTAARLDMSNLPEDCWDGLEEVNYGEHLVISTLGRAGRKYLALYRAVHEGKGDDLSALEGLELSEAELLKVSRWLREQSLFDHQRGDLLMEILMRLRS